MTTQVCVTTGDTVITTGCGSPLQPSFTREPSLRNPPFQADLHLGFVVFPPSLTDTQLATADRKRDLLIKGFKIVLTYSIETIQD